MASPKPNIVLINCDDLGYGDIGPYGSMRNRTPRLDRMAAEGMRFTDFYMASPVCSPSRAGLLTGCYPQRVGLAAGYTQGVLFPADPIGLHPDEVSMGRVLRDAGYATCCIGKWHLGDQPPFLPKRHGFDRYFGLPYSNDMEPGNTRLIEARGLAGMPPLPLMDGDGIVETQPDQAGLTHRYTRAADAFIRAHRDRPFFLYFAHMYVHNPLHPPADFLARSDNGPYGAEVECIDWSVGVLLDTLAELGLDERTLVIFTSDNGAWSGNEGSSNAPLRGEKGTTWEGGLRIPCIARWPGHVPGGTTCGELVAAMDLLPTFAGLAGAPLPEDRRIDGADIRPLLFGETDAATPHDAFFYYHGYHLEAVRSGRWKLHLRRRVLYNLADDIGETRDRLADCPEVAQRLEAMAEACRRDLGDAAVGRVGEGRRPCGRVEHSRTLTPMDPHLEDAAYD